MKANNDTNAHVFIKKHKGTIFLILIIMIILFRLITGPETVAYGNGYSHKIGLFGKCDINSDDCTNDATHRRHHFFGNEDYCDACWDIYGQDMFERLSDTKSDSSVLDYDQNKCRRSGCGNRAEYSDWDRRFCVEHLQGSKYCRYPNCDQKIPINGLSNYCSKHQ